MPTRPTRQTPTAGFTSFVDEFNAIIESIRRRYGATRRAALAHAPAYYRERVTEDYAPLALPVRFGGGLDEDAILRKAAAKGAAWLKSEYPSIDVDALPKWWWRTMPEWNDAQNWMVEVGTAKDLVQQGYVEQTHAHRLVADEYSPGFWCGARGLAISAPEQIAPQDEQDYPLPLQDNDAANIHRLMRRLHEVWTRVIMYRLHRNLAEELSDRLFSRRQKTVDEVMEGLRSLFDWRKKKTRRDEISHKEYIKTASLLFGEDWAAVADHLRGAEDIADGRRRDVKLVFAARVMRDAGMAETTRLDRDWDENVFVHAVMGCLTDHGLDIFTDRDSDDPLTRLLNLYEKNGVQGVWHAFGQVVDDFGRSWLKAPPEPDPRIVEDVCKFFARALGPDTSGERKIRLTPAQVKLLEGILGTRLNNNKAAREEAEEILRVMQDAARHVYDSNEMAWNNAAAQPSEEDLDRLQGQGDKAFDDAFEAARRAFAAVNDPAKGMTIPWSFSPDDEQWVIKTTWNRLDKAGKAKAAAQAVSYEEERGMGIVVYEWPGEPGTRWWVTSIPDSRWLKIDGTAMGHCTKNPDFGHMEDLDNGIAKFFSLRREFVDGEGVVKARRVYTLKVEGRVGSELRGNQNRIPGFEPTRGAGSESARRMTSDDEAAFKMIEFMAQYPKPERGSLVPPPEIMPFVSAVRGFEVREDDVDNCDDLVQLLKGDQDIDPDGFASVWPGASGVRRNPSTTPRDILAEAARLMAVPAFSRT